MRGALRIATEADIPVIRNLAERIWNQHYPSIIGQEQVNYMLQMMYSEESLSQQLKEGNLFYLVTGQGGEAGFLSVRDEGGGAWFISKFYIDQTLARRGLGTAAFNDLLQLHGPKEMRLTVNRQNYKAINFYFKMGFVIERVADFDIGSGYIMNDFLMWRGGGSGMVSPPSPSTPSQAHTSHP